MKKYDRVKKEWISEEEHARRTKARQKCKGGQEHDYVEVLPYGAEATEVYQGDTQPYYDAEEEIAGFIEKKKQELLAVGIVMKTRGYSPSGYRMFMCSVCKKSSYRA